MKNVKTFKGKGIDIKLKNRLIDVASSILKINKKTDSKSVKTKPGMKMNKKLGQHLLSNPGIVQKIIESAQITKSDTVLEIGPGTGNLTMQLCTLAKKVRCIEIDQRMVAELKKRAMASGHTNLEVLKGDALKTDFGSFTLCVANLPYQISSMFLFRLISWPKKFRAAILMFQKEFGDRLLASAGDKHYCRLSVNVQLFCKITRVCNVSAKSFNPPPKVDSVVVKLSPLPNKLEVDYQQWDAMLKIIFNRKRKTLRASFVSGSCLNNLYNLYKEYTNKILPDSRVLDTVSEFKEYLCKLLSDCYIELDKKSFEIVKVDDTHLCQLENRLAMLEMRAVELSVSNLFILYKHLLTHGIYFVKPNTENQLECLKEMFINNNNELIDVDQD